MKKLLIFATLGFFVFDIAGGGGRGCNKSSQQGKSSGKVAGTVIFSGLGCQPGQPDFNVPPCTGPYPNYKVEVYEARDEKHLKTTAMTDARGNYAIELPKGDYVIFTQSGPKEDNVKKNAFSVGDAGVVNLNLNVSTGIQ
ncbi:MAG TPA: hypothetical protein VHS96_06665 [Bacteroidia bacterium]|nr:hypothetical protein [Bacteroidia bacterium]